MLTNKTQYSFLIFGHGYGAPASGLAVYPSSSLLANIDNFNAQQFDFGLSLGDIVRKSNQTNWQNLKNNFLDKLNFPIINIPGNHDLTDADLYEQEMGDLYQSFQINSEYYLLINTGTDAYLDTEQMEFIKAEMTKISQISEIRNVFIVGHRVYWLDMNDELSQLKTSINGVYGVGDENLSKFMTEQIEKLADKQIYLIAGDIGINQFPSVLYFEENNVRFLATGIGDTEKDLAVVTKIDNGKVSFELLALSGQNLAGVAFYSPIWWQQNLTATTAVSSLPQLSWLERAKALPHKMSFWAGIGCGVTIIFALLFIKFFKNKKNSK